MFGWCMGPGRERVAGRWPQLRACGGGSRGAREGDAGLARSQAGAQHACWPHVKACGGARACFRRRKNSQLAKFSGHKNRTPTRVVYHFLFRSFLLLGLLAQWIARWTSDPTVAGSSPAQLRRFFPSPAPGLNLTPPITLSFAFCKYTVLCERRRAVLPAVPALGGHRAGRAVQHRVVRAAHAHAGTGGRARGNQAFLFAPLLLLAA